MTKISLSELTTLKNLSYWEPVYLLIDHAVQEHPKVKYIVNRCPNAQIVPIEMANYNSDKDIMKSIPAFLGLNEKQLQRASRKALLLTSQDELFQSMAVGHTKERCCYNFLKIIPYRGVCQASCAYCWFQDKIIIPRVNVSFVDDFISFLNSDQSSPFNQTVFTMTHYKTDCICIEHLTGFISDLYYKANELNGAYIQILTKFSNFEFLYDLPAKKELIICFSINSQSVNSLLENKTSTVDSRIKSAKRLKEMGYTVMFRVDPMLSYENCENEYSALVSEILNELTPDQITLGTPRFQTMKEVDLCLSNLKDKQRKFFSYTTKQICKNKPGIPIAGKNHSKEAYFKNMQYSLPYDIRKLLYQSFIDTSKHFSYSRIGLCEEPVSMWHSVGLNRTGRNTVDCL